MGSTGNSTGAHLHFGIKRDGKWIDPEPYLDKDYIETEEAKTMENTLPVLKKGAKSETVRALQILLAGRGYNGNMGKPDGIFGPNTLGAVKSYQKAKGLEVDGIVGPKTWASLLGL